ncbi:MAG: hypothetical protein EAX86_09270 [Candidatus Heimdallarchaeota archaeon]|nr:hypothetical protein [Candidatus Heimdallarchaeota archaeon]
MTLENEKLVENFLKEIKKHLPDWLKSNEEKLDDIMLEISSHIWDSAQEIAGSEEPNTASVQEAITRLGNPKEIARNYKKRGNPKYFISEELWSIYMKVNLYLIAILFGLIMIVQIVIVEPNNLQQAVANTLTTSYPVIITFILVVIAIFVGLSDEGYFPKDLVLDEDKKADKEEDPKSQYYKPDEFVLSGILGIFFGLIIIILPIDLLNLFRIIVGFIIGLVGSDPSAFSTELVSISVELQTLLVIMGIVSVIVGITNLAKIRTDDMKFHLNMNIILLIGGVVDLGLSLYVLVNLHLLLEVLPLSENILLFFAVLGVLAGLVDIFSTISRNIKLYGLLEEGNHSSAS